MDSYSGAQISELIGIDMHWRMAYIFNKDSLELYSNDGSILMSRNEDKWIAIETQKRKRQYKYNLEIAALIAD